MFENSKLTDVEKHIAKYLEHKPKTRIDIVYNSIIAKLENCSWTLNNLNYIVFVRDHETVQHPFQRLESIYGEKYVRELYSFHLGLRITIEQAQALSSTLKVQPKRIGPTRTVYQYLRSERDEHTTASIFNSTSFYNAMGSS